jgi:hypothetical protein
MHWIVCLAGNRSGWTQSASASDQQPIDLKDLSPQGQSGEPMRRSPVSLLDSGLRSMGRIQVRRRFLCTLGRHLCWRRNAGNTSGPKQLLLDVILGFPREAIIELARWTKYQHLSALLSLRVFVDCWMTQQSCPPCATIGGLRE